MFRNNSSTAVSDGSIKPICQSEQLSTQISDVELSQVFKRPRFLLIQSEKCLIVPAEAAAAWKHRGKSFGTDMKSSRFIQCCREKMFFVGLAGQQLKSASRTIEEITTINHAGWPDAHSGPTEPLAAAPLRPTVLHSIRTEESNLLTTAELSEQTESQSEQTTPPDRLLGQRHLLLKTLLLLLPPISNMFYSWMCMKPVNSIDQSVSAVPFCWCWSKSPEPIKQYISDEENM